MSRNEVRTVLRNATAAQRQRVLRHLASRNDERGAQIRALAEQAARIDHLLHTVDFESPLRPTLRATLRRTERQIATAVDAEIAAQAAATH